MFQVPSSNDKKAGYGNCRKLKIKSSNLIADYRGNAVYNFHKLIFRLRQLVYYINLLF